MENNQIIERNEIENTPFVMVTLEQGSFVALGNYRVSEVYETKEEAENYIKTITWDNLFNVIISLFEHLKNINVSELTEKSTYKIN
jgi:hypothetical protein